MGSRAFVAAVLVSLLFLSAPLGAETTARSLPTPLAAGTATRPVQLSRIVLKLSRGEAYGRVSAGLLCLGTSRLTWKAGRHDLSLDDFDDVFGDTLKDLGFSVIGGTAELFEDVSDRRAEYLVGGTITMLSVDACMPNWGLGDSLSIKGKATMAMDWSVYSRLERKVVARVSTQAKFERKKADLSGVTGLVAGAFEDNLNALLATGTLNRLLVGTPVDQTVARTAKPDIPVLHMKLPTRSAGKLADVVGATVLVLSGGGHGSGFLVSGDGYFLTNHHVVGGDKYVKLRWSDGLEGVGEVVRFDRGRDVALIKGDARGRAPIRLRSAPAPTGLDVYAVGAPLEPSLQNSVTRGIVSATRVLDGYSFIQSDVSVQHGNSGGPLVDEAGDLVGLAESGVEIHDAPAGVNFFVPAREALLFLAIEPD